MHKIDSALVGGVWQLNSDHLAWLESCRQILLADRNLGVAIVARGGMQTPLQRGDEMHYSRELSYDRIRPLSSHAKCVVTQLKLYLALRCSMAAELTPAAALATTRLLPPPPPRCAI